MKPPKKANPILAFLRHLVVIVGAILLTLLFFLVLPVMQTIAEKDQPDTVVQNVSAGDVPPPAPIEPEPEQPPQPDETPPELAEDVAPIDLAALELNLTGGTGSGPSIFVPKIDPTAALKKGGQDLFSFAQLDQQPRPINQPGPVMDARVRKQTADRAVTVYVVFIIGKDGTVEDARVQKARNNVLDKAAVDAVKKWTFDPGKRKGEPVRFRMRVPITFPKG